MTDPDIELRRGVGGSSDGFCFAFPAGFSFFCDFLSLFTQNKGGGGGLTPRSTTAFYL